MKINSLSPASSPIIIIIMFIPSVKRYDYLPLKVKYKTIISVKELEVEHNLLKRLTVCISNVCNRYLLYYSRDRW